MKLRSITALAFLAAAIPAFSQQGQGPKPHSQKEVDALRKVQADQQASNWSQELQDINFVLENFENTEFKPQLLTMAFDAAQRQGDYAQTVAWGERLIQENPNDPTGPIQLAETIANHTRENDLDRDQSVKKVEDNANKGLSLLKTANTPPQGISADQWPAYKKQLEGQAHDAMGLAYAAQKNYPKAINEYQAALAAFPNPIIQVHMISSYINSKQYDDAISTADKVIAAADAPANVKQVAQQLKDQATKLKGTK